MKHCFFWLSVLFTLQVYSADTKEEVVSKVWEILNITYEPSLKGMQDYRQAVGLNASLCSADDVVAAVCSGRLELVKLLVAEKVDVTREGRFLSTPLEVAVKTCKPYMVKALYASGQIQKDTVVRLCDREIKAANRRFANPSDEAKYIYHVPRESLSESVSEWQKIIADMQCIQAVTNKP